MSNMVDARTRIEDNQETRDKALKSTANILADFILMNGTERGGIGSLKKDIQNLLKGYSSEEKVTILVSALAFIGASTSGGATSGGKKKNKKKNSSDFGMALGAMGYDGSWPD